MTLQMRDLEIREEGIEIGRAEGRAEDRANTVSMVGALVKSNVLSIEQAISGFKLTAGEIDRIMAMM